MTSDMTTLLLPTMGVERWLRSGALATQNLRTWAPTHMKDQVCFRTEPGGGLQANQSSRKPWLSERHCLEKGGRKTIEENNQTSERPGLHESPHVLVHLYTQNTHVYMPYIHTHKHRETETYRQKIRLWKQSEPEKKEVHHCLIYNNIHACTHTHTHPK